MWHSVNLAVCLCIALHCSAQCAVNCSAQCVQYSVCTVQCIVQCAVCSVQWQWWESNLAKCLSYTRELPLPPASSYLCLYYTILSILQKPRWRPLETSDLKRKILKRHFSSHKSSPIMSWTLHLQDELGMWIRVFHKNTFSKEKVVHTLTCP